MKHHMYSSKLILTIVAWLVFLSAHPAWAGSEQTPVRTGPPNTTRGAAPGDPANGPIFLTLTPQEADAVASALPEGETKDMFNKKAKAVSKEKEVSTGISYKRGEGLI